MFDFAISMYSFHPLLKSGDITPRAAARFAHSVGYQGIEMLDLYWKEGPRQAQADALAADARAEEMPVACYTVHNNLALFDEAPWRELVDRMLSDVEIAARLGTRVMRVESTGGAKAPHEGKSFEECLAPVAKGLKTVARRAAEMGIKVGVENHGRFAGTSERVERIIDAVGEDNFGACIDIGNFLVVDEEPVSAVARLAPRAVHVHAKDMHLFQTDPGQGAFPTNAGKYLRGAVLGEGVVDAAKCLDLIAKAGYRGWLALEFEGRENLFFGIARGVENLAGCARRLPMGR